MDKINLYRIFEGNKCGTYTDLMVVDHEPEFNGDRTDEILNPLLIYDQLDQIITLECLKLELPLQEIYHRVEEMIFPHSFYLSSA
jgi:hypothetical protein